MLAGLTKKIIVLDTETQSAIDLKRRGAGVYFADASTRTLLVGFKDYAEKDAPAEVWQSNRHAMPQKLRHWARATPEDVMFAAFNAAFDRQALRLVGIDTPVEKWVDVALLAYMLCFSGSLADVLEQTGIPHAKSKDGGALITRFSKNREPWFSSPLLWDRFAAYCANDVEIESELMTFCLRTLDTPELHPMVRRVHSQWVMDQHMNNRGMPIDMATVRGAMRIKKRETARILARMKALTGIENPNSVVQLLEWTKARGCGLKDLQAENIRESLDLGLVDDPDVRTALEMRLEIGKASVKKFDALSRMTVNGRLYNSYTTYGASRTGRTASRGMNVSNLERPSVKNADEAADIVATGSHDLVSSLYDVPVMSVLGSSVRGAICAPPGKAITALDLKSIESVGLAWLSGCDTILDIFFDGRDSYKAFGSVYYRKPYDAITADERQFAKPIVLGCGYGASGGALTLYAKKYGVEMEAEVANGAVKAFRTAYSEIPAFWSNLESAAKGAVRFVGVPHYVHRGQPTQITYLYDGTYLRATLPSGRTIFYHLPSVKVHKPRRDSDWEVESLFYFGKKQDDGGAWQYISTHGGMLAGNVTQALCRDVLYEALERIRDLQDPNIEVVGSTYDEVIALTPEGDTETWGRVKDALTTRSSWMDDRFFLGCSGYTNARRYRK